MDGPKISRKVLIELNCQNIRTTQKAPKAEKTALVAVELKIPGDLLFSLDCTNRKKHKIDALHGTGFIDDDALSYRSRIAERYGVASCRLRKFFLMLDAMPDILSV